MITIFTPTYNRAYKLPALYNSLLQQTDTNFEWIVVDDGSEDNTAELVNRWIADTKSFQIRYYYQANSGKHVAINYAVKKANYDWFFIVDSDDFLTRDAVALVHEWISTVDTSTIATVAGISCYPDGKVIGQCGVKDCQYLDARNNERRKFRLLGDKAEVYRTDILKQFPFPEFPGERFLSEGAVWDAIAIAGYKIRWFPNPIKVCEYLDDGLSAQIQRDNLEVRNFEGCTYYTLTEIQAHTGIDKLRVICQYINKARKKGLSLCEISEKIHISRAVCYFLVMCVCIKNLCKNR